MSVKIRLRRTGKVNQPSHRIVVTDIRSPRNGTFIECIGYYDPRHKVEKVEVDRAAVVRGHRPAGRHGGPLDGVEGTRCRRR